MKRRSFIQSAIAFDNPKHRLHRSDVTRHEPLAALVLLSAPSDIPALGYSWDKGAVERTITINGKTVERTRVFLGQDG